MKKQTKINLYLLSLILLFSCSGDGNYVPKPHAYPRMIFPEKKYALFHPKNCPFVFKLPTYSQVREDERSRKLFWYNVEFPTYQATLHLTYYKFNDWAGFDSMVADTRSLVNKHLQRAEDILEDPIENYNPNLHGVMFHIQGNTASNLNFYVTDSVQHFVRGALYFNEQTENDSILPVYHFLQKDVEQLLKTFKYK